MEASIEFLKGELLRKGLRPSFHRIKVLEYLYRAQGHPTVDEIFAHLSAEIPSVSKATVYNTLHSFVEVGLARTISLNGIEQRFDIMLHNHGHFKCERCGAIINFKIDIDSLAVDELAQFEIRDKNVIFSGLCPKCLHPHREEKE